MFSLPHKMKLNCICQYSNKILFLMQLIDVVAVLVKEMHCVSSSSSNYKAGLDTTTTTTG